MQWSHMLIFFLHKYDRVRFEGFDGFQKFYLSECNRKMITGEYCNE